MMLKGQESVTRAHDWSDERGFTLTVRHETGVLGS
jgi:hypothetical protein